ncbi:ABC transporter permease [Aerophototrophica crusticola]|uniref:ABC transporter permease n=1 Tax=Aerophototrophica crusticola TaxID=1709002 RepID=A0A858R5G5_9PROT|nr:ABC transporter permease [Rhodospirillaceae bacterium B3]
MTGNVLSRLRQGGLADLAVGLVVPVTLLLAWEVAGRAGWISTKLLPAPSTVLAAIATLVESGELWTHVWATLWRVLVGFGLGVAAGTAIGALTGYSTLARRLLDPTIQALRNIPSIAWVPLFILWFGIFETSKVLLIAVGVFFPVYLNLASAIHDVDRKLVEVARVYRYNGWQMVTRVLLPAALPTYVIGLRSGLGLGWMFVVAAEIMGASEGLGYLLVDGQMSGRTPVILGSITLFAILGKMTDLALARATAPLAAWQDGFKGKG